MITLYEHQKKALPQMHNGCILCGGVGSGKSITSLVYFYETVCGGKLSTKEGEPNRPMRRPRDLYIITTARKRNDLEWDRELIPFGLSSHEELSPIKVTIDSWNNLHKYKEVRGGFFIFDEQRVVGYGAWTKSFLRITESNLWILLSATPGDTWGDYIPVFIANGFYRNKTEFICRHVIYSRFAKYPKVERYIDIERLEECKRKVLVDMPFERRTISHPVLYEVSYDKRLFMQVFRGRWNPYTEQPIRQAGEWCYTLRRVVNEDSERLTKVFEILEDHEKLIIFYNFDYELEALKNGLNPYLQSVGVPLSEYNGHKHEAIPQTDSWVYLVQFAAGSEAWNCIATDTIVFYSLNYSYKMMEQASGRINRANTPYRDLYYYVLYSKSPIDKSILTALKNKRSFNENKFYTKNSREITSNDLSASAIGDRHDWMDKNRRSSSNYNEMQTM